MAYPIGEVCGHFKLIAFNEMEPDHQHLIAECECGNLFQVTREQFVNKLVDSCGCKTETKTRIEGRKFAMLTIISAVKKEGSNRYYLCKCDCGNTKEIAYSNLASGRSKSCGCVKRSNIENDSEVHIEPKNKAGRPKKLPEPDTKELMNKFKGLMARQYLINNGQAEYVAEFDRAIAMRDAGVAPELLPGPFGSA